MTPTQEWATKFVAHYKTTPGIEENPAFFVMYELAKAILADKELEQ